VIIETGHDCSRSPRHSRSRYLRTQKAQVDTPKLRASLDFLQPHIQPAWLVPQFCHNLDGERKDEYAAREGQQTNISRHVSRYPKFSQNANRKAGGCSSARNFHDTHDMAVKDELSACLKSMGNSKSRGSLW